jgi:hypothetical protein
LEPLGGEDEHGHEARGHGKGTLPLLLTASLVS